MIYLAHWYRAAGGAERGRIPGEELAAAAAWLDLAQ